MSTKEKWESLIRDAQQKLQSIEDISRKKRIEGAIELFRTMMERDEPFPGEFNGYGLRLDLFNCDSTHHKSVESHHP